VPADPAHPPLAILSFLAHTQVSYDAAYISPASLSNPSVPRLGTPPRTTSLKSTAGSGGLHVPPNIFPQNTPNPAPVTTEQSRRYVRAEGVPLASGMWGEELDTSKPGQDKDRDAFALLWDETAGIWVAVYRMCVNVGAFTKSFDRLSHSYSVPGSILAVARSRPVALSHSIDHYKGEADSHDASQGCPFGHVRGSRRPTRVAQVCGHGDLQ
jgi:hypothetical protein